MEALKNSNSIPGNINQDNKLPILSKKFIIIDDNYACFKNFVIGSGSFGKVLYGMSLDRLNEYAIKFEKSNIKNSVILEELKIYYDLKGGEGIPKIHWEGEYKKYKVFIMDLLGPSLDKFFKINNKLNLETSLFLGEQMVRRLEYLHSKNYIHRDIKPNNFLLGRYNRKFNDNNLYIIDFGLSKEYRDKKTNKHYDYNESSKFVGTPRYASVNTHLGIRQSRRDDLESVAYILIYFLNGDLPWQGIKAKTKSEKKEKIKISKNKFDVSTQCENIPLELIEFLEYTKKLDFYEKPNYDYLVSLLIKIRNEKVPNKILNPDFMMWEWNEKFLKNKNELKEPNMFDLQSEKLFYKLYEGYPIQDFNEFLDCLEKIDQENQIFFKKQFENVDNYNDMMNTKKLNLNQNMLRDNNDVEMNEIDSIINQTIFKNKKHEKNLEKIKYDNDKIPFNIGIKNESSESYNALFLNKMNEIPKEDLNNYFCDERKVNGSKNNIKTSYELVKQINNLSNMNKKNK